MLKREVHEAGREMERLFRSVSFHRQVLGRLLKESDAFLTRAAIILGGDVLPHEAIAQMAGLPQAIEQCAKALGQAIDLGHRAFGVGEYHRMVIDVDGPEDDLNFDVTRLSGKEVHSLVGIMHDVATQAHQN